MNETIKKTIKLYNVKPYDINFEASVLHYYIEDNRYFLILDQTLFFPEEGGQTPDKGKINDIDVINVQIKNNIIYHELAENLSVINGNKVNGTISWEHRFSNMQQHSAEHIFSGLVHRYFHYDNVGFHLSDQTVTMDFNGILNDEDILRLETEVNEIISKNIPITVSYPSKEEQATLEYRSKKEILEELRIVTIEGIDTCACCAPHVRTTGEIGILKVINTQSWKGGVRINILCGFRALNDYRSKMNIVSELVVLLSEKPENLINAVTKLKNNISNLKMDMNKKSYQLLEYKMNSLDFNIPDLFLFETDLDNNTMRAAVNSLKEKCTGVCGIFSYDSNNTDKAEMKFIISSSTTDCRNYLNNMKKSFEIRGGGNAEMVQGTVFASECELKSYLY